MRALVLTLAAVALVATVTTSGAGANGSPYSPGLVYGWDGVLARDGKVRYVTLSTEYSTVVAAVRTNGGRILRSRSFNGFFGIPLVAYDGTSGGLSGDGRRLVISSYGPVPGTSGTTRFFVLDTRTLRTKRVARLGGSWSFDAVAPDGSILYLTHHIRAGESPLYRVRSYDVRTGLLRGPVVDRIEGAEDMGGEPVTRATSWDGRWAYTLYARAEHGPFIHALDTAKREAFCIGLPLRMSRDDQWQLRLKLRERSGRLSVLAGARMLARVDTRSFDVEEEKS
jgi:hypothetical protein